ncbi:MFS transporter [Neobacillus notoginsengisoli]|uniref:MFS transporter n=1 Tax=Neobacillus notoginsengisoli TaxID=1578198 RepID=A0A417YEP0_9BACI|nr:MFS transporter [Neobacillus notoginsengisoli]RHW31146.1 MFS transporter [Neobacillus notoginsengisoli]
MKGNMFSALKNKSFRSLFTAQIFSDLGNWLDFIAIQVVIAYHWGLGEGAIAAVIIAMGLPWVVIGPFAGVFVERLSKKTVMISSLALKLVFVAGLYFSPNLYFLLFFVLLKGTAAALYDPARQSMIRSVVPEDELPQAVTLSQLSVNSTKIIGPALGAALISLFGAKSPFLFEIAGFFIGLLFLFLLPKVEKPHVVPNLEQKKENSSFRKEFLAGIRHIYITPLLKLSVILSAAAFFIIFLYDGLFVFIVKEIGFNGEEFGLLVSAVGFGSVAGSILLGNWTKWKSLPIQLMASSSLFSGTLIVAIGLGGLKIFSLPQVGWMAGAFLLGLLGSSQSVPYGYVLQSQTPGDMMARVSAAAASIQTFSMLIAPAAGAMLAKMIGVSYVMVWAGALTSLLGLGILLTRLTANQAQTAKLKA